MLYIKKHKLEGKIKMLLQIHDELIFEIKSADVKEHVPKLLAIMDGALEGKETQGVPIVAEVKVGKTWGDLKSM